MNIEDMYKLTNTPVDDEVSQTVINNFNNGKIMYSERMNSVFDGILFDLTNEMKEKIESLKKEGVEVIHVLKWQSVFGEEIDYIINDEMFEEDGVLYCFALCTNSYVEEMGEIGIKSINGGFTRVS